MTRSLPNRQDAVNELDDGLTAELPARTPAGDAFTGIVVRVLQIHGLLAAAGDALARPAGQTSARWQVMAAVEHGPSTVAQIARLLGLARQSVQRVADLLAGEGLAAYEDNPTHRRAKLLALTPDGARTLRSIQLAQRAWADALGAEAGEKDLRAAVRGLDRVKATLERHAPRTRSDAPRARTT